MVAVDVARQFKASEESDGRYGIAWVEEGRLHLQHNFLHHLGYVAWHGFVVVR